MRRLLARLGVTWETLTPDEACMWLVRSGHIGAALWLCEKYTSEG